MMNEADLVAYVDGRLPADQTRAIAKAASTDAALAARIDELAAGSPDLSSLWVDMMRSVPDGLMPEPPDAAGMQISRRAWL